MRQIRSLMYYAIEKRELRELTSNSNDSENNVGLSRACLGAAFTLLVNFIFCLEVIDSNSYKWIAVIFALLLGFCILFYLKGKEKKKNYEILIEEIEDSLIEKVSPQEDV